MDGANFWKDVLQAWVNLCDCNKISNSNQLMSSPIWYNPKITSENLYFPNWFKQGVECIGDLVSPTGMFINPKELENKFNINEQNFINIIRLEKIITKYVKSQHTEIKELIRPHVPCDVAIVLCNNKKTKGFYQLLGEKNIRITATEKWEGELNLQIDPLIWKKLFKICFKTIQDNYYIWFQYRIIHRILGTRKLLHSIGKVQASECIFCKLAPETLIHLFCDCTISKQLWNDIENWITHTTSFPIKFSPVEILLGYLNPDNFYPINTIILVTKAYIFSKSRKALPLDISDLKNNIRQVYDEQQYMALIDEKQEIFVKTWTVFKNIFLS